MPTDQEPIARPPDGPRSVGRYELGEAIGTAAFGALHRGKVVSGSDAGRQVVVRVIERSRIDVDSVDLLSGVGFSAMEVRDPRVAAVLDVVVDDSAVAIISEQVPGVRLAELLERAQQKDSACPVPVALHIVKDLVLALIAAKSHWAEIYSDTSDPEERRRAAALHGGLVPDNVIIASFGDALVCDIGVSGAAMTLDGLRDTVEALSHRAPEQITGHADERSDVFTVGVFLWELLVGRALFGPTAIPRIGKSSVPPPSMRAGSPLATVKRKLESGSIQRLDTLPKLTGKVSKALADLVARATERDAKVRFTSLADLRSALDALPDEVAAADAVVLNVTGAPPPSGSEGRDSGRISVSNRPTHPGDRGSADRPSSDDERTTKTAAIKVPEPSPFRIEIDAAPASDADPISVPPPSLDEVPPTGGGGITEWRSVSSGPRHKPPEPAPASGSKMILIAAVAAVAALAVGLALTTGAEEEPLGDPSPAPPQARPLAPKPRLIAVVPPSMSADPAAARTDAGSAPAAPEESASPPEAASAPAPSSATPEGTEVKLSPPVRRAPAKVFRPDDI